MSAVMRDMGAGPLIGRMRTDLLDAPVSIETKTPEFSWVVEGDKPQRAYQIQLSRDPEDWSGLLWDSGRVEAATPFGVRYAGVGLRSNERYYWRVRAWTSLTEPEWSAVARFDTGALSGDFWKAMWIAASLDQGLEKRALYLRGTAELSSPVARARAFVSALGWYRFFVNGRDISGNALVPRWTPLDTNVEYQVFDVTDALASGTNIFAMAVGDGRYRGHSGIAERYGVYGDRLAGFVQLEIEHEDGSTSRFCTDTGWLAGPGRIIRTDPKHGEQSDFSADEADWLSASVAPARFAPAAILAAHKRCLIAEQSGKVKEVARLRPVKIWRAPSGKLLVDFGQNFAGVARLRPSAPPGTTLTLTFSEVIGRDGELDTGYLMPGTMKDHPPQRDIFVVGETRQWCQPWFTIHGFRFVEIDGLEVDPTADDVEAIVLTSDLDYHGSFECSDAAINALYRNIKWSMVSNFVDTPTDCPTRERSGWTGDIQIFSPTAANYADVQAYLRSYLRNLAIEQLPDGSIPPYIPSDGSEASGPIPSTMRVTTTSTGWGDASIMVPMNLYRYYGDSSVLKRQYVSMQRWVSMLQGLAEKSPGRGRLIPRRLGGLERFVVDSGYHWGEWLRPGESMAKTYFKHRVKAPAVVATAYFANSARLLGEVAAIIGKEDDAARYDALAVNVRAAWQKAFVRKAGARIGDDKQDDYVRALAFDLLEPDWRPNALARLVELIRAAGTHLATGFLSTPMLLSTLARFGRPDLAYELLMQESNPSWLFQVKNGATTTWESWEGYNAKGDARYSHNHYAFGAVAQWLVEAVAGLAPAAPGYRTIAIRPTLGGGLTNARARVMTPYGPASSSWAIVADTLTLEVDIPAGATAIVAKPGGGNEERVESGRHRFEWRLDS